MAAAPYTPVGFPELAEKIKLKFRDDLNTGTMSRDVYQELYRHGCVEVDPIPAMDLQNGIHVIFRQAAFGNITAEQYNRMRPALTLASRFITEDAYLGYWAHLCTANLVEDTSRALGPGETKRGRVLQADPNITEHDARKRAQNAFTSLANNLTFFFLDDAYSSSADVAVAESYFGDIHRECRYRLKVNGECNRSDCRACAGEKKLRCAGCGGTWYEDSTLKELRDAVRARQIVNTKARKAADLVTALKQHDQDTDGVPSQEVSGRVQNRTNLPNLQIGVHQHAKQHIERATAAEAQDIWSQSEEVRFQFSLAATLTHELVHVFWWWTQLRCGLCEGNEPWWSENEDKIHFGPELGNSWEWWAFGSRVPTGRKIQENAEEEPRTIFSRSNWSQTFQTKTSGFYFQPCVSHSYVFPMEWINSWFQEATWVNIRTNGREAGRPSHDNLIVMSQLGTKMVDDENFNTYKCEIEDYSHPELVAQGGFTQEIKPALYAKSKMTSEELMLRHINKVLRRRVHRRNNKVMRDWRAKRRTTTPVSIYKLNKNYKITTRMEYDKDETKDQMEYDTETEDDTEKEDDTIMEDITEETETGGAT